MKDDKQENKKQLPIISSLCGHKSDKEYMEHIENLYRHVLKSNPVNTVLRRYAGTEIWEATRKLPNNERISAFGTTEDEAKERLIQKYEYHIEKLKFIEKIKQEELNKQNETESPEME